MHNVHVQYKTKWNLHSYANYLSRGAGFNIYWLLRNAHAWNMSANMNGMSCPLPWPAILYPTAHAWNMPTNMNVLSYHLPWPAMQNPTAYAWHMSANMISLSCPLPWPAILCILLRMREICPPIWQACLVPFHGLPYRTVCFHSGCMIKIWHTKINNFVNFIIIHLFCQNKATF